MFSSSQFDVSLSTPFSLARALLVRVLLAFARGGTEEKKHFWGPKFAAGEGWRSLLSSVWTLTGKVGSSSKVAISFFFFDLHAKSSFYFGVSRPVEGPVPRSSRLVGTYESGRPCRKCEEKKRKKKLNVLVLVHCARLLC